MKRALLILAMAAVLLTFAAVPALAASGDSSGTVIQVVVPDTATPTAPKIYPTDVTATYTPDGNRIITKTYKLNTSEAPADIPRGDFDREGWRYTLTDITHDGDTNYTAHFIGTPLDQIPTSSTTALPAPFNSMPLVLIAAMSVLLAGLSLGYLIFHKNGRKK